MKMSRPTIFSSPVSLLLLFPQRQESHQCQEWHACQYIPDHTVSYMWHSSAGEPHRLSFARRSPPAAPARAASSRVTDPDLQNYHCRRAIIHYFNRARKVFKQACVFLAEGISRTASASWMMQRSAEVWWAQTPAARRVARRDPLFFFRCWHRA